MGLLNIFKKKSEEMSNASSSQKQREEDLINDERFRKYSKENKEYLTKGEYGYYRNNLFAMSEIEKKDGHYHDQLRLLCLVFYIDLSGVSSLEQCKYVLKEKVSIVTPIIAPGIVKRIKTAMKQCGYDTKDLLKFYYEEVSETMLPVHLYTKEQTKKFLEKAVVKGVDDANAMIKKPKQYTVINI